MPKLAAKRSATKRNDVVLATGGLETVFPSHAISALTLDFAQQFLCSFCADEFALEIVPDHLPLVADGRDVVPARLRAALRLTIQPSAPACVSQ
jgi:hypothetical protein